MFLVVSSKDGRPESGWWSRVKTRAIQLLYSALILELAVDICLLALLVWHLSPIIDQYTFPNGKR